MGLLEKLAYKLILGKSHTGDTKSLLNEKFNSHPIIQADHIWADKINLSSPTHPDNKKVLTNKLDLLLTQIPNSKAYYITVGSTVPSVLSNLFNPLTNQVFKPFDRIGNIISINFGFDFRPVAFNGDSEISIMDSCNWVIDYASGILIQEGDQEFTSLSAYVYIGSTVYTKMNNISPTIPNNTSQIKFLDHQCIGKGILQDSYNKYLLDYVPDEGSVHLYINGVLQKEVSDYNVSGNFILLSENIILDTDDFLTISYRTTING